MIRSEEISVLKETCRNSRKAVEAIDTVLNKVYDEELAYDLNCQRKKYGQLERKAERMMMEEGIRPRDNSRVEKVIQWSSIQASTLLNTSTRHVADMMIQGKTKGLTGLKKVAHNNKISGSFANELASELIDFEEKNIEKLKSYLN
jgi:hypothetical protein